MVPVAGGGFAGEIGVVPEEIGQLEIVEMLGQERGLGFHEGFLGSYGVGSAGGRSRSRRSWRRVR